MHHVQVKRTLWGTVRAIGWAFLYLFGLVFVALTTDSVYVDLNLKGTAAWEECDDCGAFMANEAWFWVKITLALYTAIWIAFVVRAVRRWRRRNSADRITADHRSSSGHV